MLSITNLLDALATSQGDKHVRDAVSSWLNVPASKTTKGKSKSKKSTSASADGEGSGSESTVSKPKKQGPDAWNAFIAHVCGPKDEPTQAFKAWCEEQPADLKGSKRMLYATTMKAPDAGNYEQFKANFKPTPSSSSSVTSTNTTETAVKRKPGRPRKNTEAKPTKPAASKKQSKKVIPVLPESDSESETESGGEPDSLPKIEIFGQDFFWDCDKEILYSVNDDGTCGEECGHYDGTTANFG